MAEPEASEQTVYAKVVTKAWGDPAFKSKLLADPAAALAAAGVTIPAGVTVKVLEDTDKLAHLVLPARPAEGELSDEALQKIAAAGLPEFALGDKRSRKPDLGPKIIGRG